VLGRNNNFVGNQESWVETDAKLSNKILKMEIK
jgi:hypothetical protein